MCVNVDQFALVPVPASHHQEGGILPSEANAVLQLCRMLGVVKIIESGRWKGFSTELFASHLDPQFDVLSLDYTYQDFYRSVEKRLAKFPRLTLLYGDAFKLLPYIIYRLDRPAALFMDGPKGPDAVELIRQCFKFSGHLKLAFLHDSYKGSDARAAAEKTFKHVWFTDDEKYCEKFSYLDESAESTYSDPSYRDAIRDKYHFRRELIGHSEQSYGPTLACFWRDKDDIPAKKTPGKDIQLYCAYLTGLAIPKIRRIYKKL